MIQTTICWGGKLSIINGELSPLGFDSDTPPYEKRVNSENEMYRIQTKNTTKLSTLKYYSLFSVTSIIGKITPIPSKA